MSTATSTTEAASLTRKVTVVTATEVRAWAEGRKINGKVGVAARGSLPAEVIDAYNKAHKAKRYERTIVQPSASVLTIEGRKTDARGRKNRTTYKVDVPTIRAWARENGVEVGERGRIPASVKAAYAAAMSEVTA